MKRDAKHIRMSAKSFGCAENSVKQDSKVKNIKNYITCFPQKE